jgi:hypothetical protein
MIDGGVNDPMIVLDGVSKVYPGGDAPAVDIRGAIAVPAIKGHGDPPDPYPPRAVVLS